MELTCQLFLFHWMQVIYMFGSSIVILNWSNDLSH